MNFTLWKSQCNAALEYVATENSQGPKGRDNDSKPVAKRNKTGLDGVI